MIRFLYIYIKIRSYILLRAVGCVCHDDYISVRSVKMWLFQEMHIHTAIYIIPI